MRHEKKKKMICNIFSRRPLADDCVEWERKKEHNIAQKNRFLEEENFSRHFSRISTQLIECDEILKINFYKRMWWWIGNGNSRQNFFLYEFIIDWEPLRQKNVERKQKFSSALLRSFFSPPSDQILIYIYRLSKTHWIFSPILAVVKTFSLQFNKN